jgi:hypothetical protein
MRRSLRPYKLSLQQMPKASSSMSDFVYDPCGNCYNTATCLHHAYPDSTFESRLFEVQLTFYPMQHLIPDPLIAPQGNELSALSIEGGQL